jgi:plasmid stabilization system protein ParE
VADAAAFLTAEAGPVVARRLRGAVERAAVTLGRHPELGRRRDEDGLPGLRSLPVPGFPYVILYELAAGKARVLRVLHGARDLADEVRRDTGDGA